MGQLLNKAHEDMHPIKDTPVIFVSGVPGAGNRKASETLSAITGYQAIFPGDLLRNKPVNNIDLTNGRRAKYFRKKSKKPEQITIQLIKAEMLRHDNAKGFIICGFPKNVKLSAIFKREVKMPEKVVALQVADEIASMRLERKFDELGRSETEIRTAESIVKAAIPKMKKVHESFDPFTILSVDSSITNFNKWHEEIVNASNSIIKDLSLDEIDRQSRSTVEIILPDNKQDVVENVE